MKGFSLLKPYFREKLWIIVVGMFCLITVDILQLIIPRVIKWAVDDITALGIDQSQLMIYALYIAVLALTIGFFRYIWRYCLLGTSRRVEEGLRNQLFSHLQSLSPSYFDRTRTGDLMAHATNDIQQIRMATGMGMVALNDALFLGLAAIGFMAYINVKLTLYVLIPMPCIVGGTLFFTKRLHSKYQDVQHAFSQMTEVVRERLAGIRLIKAYNLQSVEAASVKDYSRGYIDKNLDLVKTTGLFFPMMLFFTNVSMALVLYIGGGQTILGSITAGDLVAFINYLGLLTWPMMAMGWVINLIQRGRASLDRVGKILQTSPDIPQLPSAGIAAGKNPSVTYDRVTFTYPGDLEPVLRDISFHLEFGSVLGIVGPAGSGKSTMVNLLPRLYEISQGQILLDGQDIRTIDLERLRSLISFAPQEAFLFSGTIRENITFNNREVREEQLQSSLQKAQLLDTVKSFPRGLDTVVGEKGVILSGGQKQRVALARAFLHQAPLLILDDPISQVDTRTGQDILEHIGREKGQKTVVIISHRLSAVREADLILVMEEGRIAESGTHDQLLKSGGYYARTIRMQTLEEELNAV